MILVEGGTVHMGNDSMENANTLIEVPSFKIAKTELTLEQWLAVKGGVSKRKSSCNKCPMTYVSWHEANEYLEGLNTLTNKSYRLPTEIEWEFAAKGGNKSQGYKYSGSNNVNEVAWNKSNSEDHAHPAGTKKGNELGIHDMSGNVIEWVQDPWLPNYESKPRYQEIPEGSIIGYMRGGSYHAEPSNSYISMPEFVNPDANAANIGFRIALSVE